MAMRMPTSILAISVNRKLLELHEQTGNDFVRYPMPTWGMAFFGRYCTVAGKRTGGYEVSASLADDYGHKCGGAYAMRKRLGCEATTKTRNWVIHVMFQDMMNMRSLANHREHVYDLEQTREINEAKVDHLALLEKMTTSFEDMDHEACDYWVDQLETFPLKEVA